MRRFEAVIQSEDSPGIGSLWLKDKKLWFFEGGDRVHYQITAEGECRKQEDRFEHSELFYNLGQVDVATLPRTLTLRDSVDMQRFKKKATNLAFEVSSNGAFIDDVSMTQVSVNSVLDRKSVV